MNKDNYVIIMAGGIGSRFWPFSRNNRPKQFLDVLGSGTSLLQMTFQRFRNICPTENILIVTNDIYAQLVHEQLPEISAEQVLLEPVRRNTAPCIAYASYKIYKKNKNACIVVSPADHAIFREDKFEKSIFQGIETAKEGYKLLTLGIQPTGPETGYGYIQYHHEGDGQVKKVKTFTEKPQLDLAKKFVESGEFVWNSGIFIWSAESILRAFQDHLQEVAEIFEEGTKHYYTTHEHDFIKTAYSQCKNISIDYGVMEKAGNVFVVLADFGWSDLGSWNSLYEIKEKDNDQNVIIESNVLTYDCKNSLITGAKDKLIVVSGLEGYLVADYENVLLICNKDDEQKFKNFVSDVKAAKGENYL